MSSSTTTMSGGQRPSEAPIGPERIERRVTLIPWPEAPAGQVGEARMRDAGWREIGDEPVGPSVEASTTEHGPFELLIGGIAVRARWGSFPTCGCGQAWAWLTEDGRTLGYYDPQGWRIPDDQSAAFIADCDRLEAEAKAIR